MTINIDYVKQRGGGAFIARTRCIEPMVDFQYFFFFFLGGGGQIIPT